MKIIAHDKFKNIVNTEVTSVVVYDDDDNPVAATVKLANGILQTVRLKDKNFYEVLHTLGIDRTVVVNSL